MNNHEKKVILRRQARNWLLNQSPEIHSRNSFEICRKVQEFEEYSKAETVLLYSPMKDELDILPLLQEGLNGHKKICLPKFDAITETYKAADITRGNEICLRKGQFGILEPGPENSEISLKRLDFCLVPGLMFGVDGTRLGRGKGYYDRLLSNFSGCKVGVCNQGQITCTVPVEQHDVLMDFVCTESNVFRKSK